MKTRYIITIKEQTQEKDIQGSEWKKGAGKTPDVYGYTPEVERTREVERVIYIQNVSELKLQDVIYAVNNI